jgi:hypothetical protein
MAPQRRARGAGVLVALGMGERGEDEEGEQKAAASKQRCGKGDLGADIVRSSTSLRMRRNPACHQRPTSS